MASSGGQLLPASRSISLCSSCSPPLSNGVLGSGQEAQGPFDSACSSERSSSSGSSCTTMARPALSASTSQDSAVVRTSSSGLGGITQQRRHHAACTIQRAWRRHWQACCKHRLKQEQAVAPEQDVQLRALIALLCEPLMVQMPVEQPISQFSLLGRPAIVRMPVRRAWRGLQRPRRGLTLRVPHAEADVAMSEVERILKGGFWKHDEPRQEQESDQGLSMFMREQMKAQERECEQALEMLSYEPSEPVLVPGELKQTLGSVAGSLGRMGQSLSRSLTKTVNWTLSKSLQAVEKLPKHAALIQHLLIPPLERSMSMSCTHVCQQQQQQQGLLQPQQLGHSDGQQNRTALFSTAAAGAESMQGAGLMERLRQLQRVSWKGPSGSTGSGSLSSPLLPLSELTRAGKPQQQQRQAKHSLAGLVTRSAIGYIKPSHAGASTYQPPQRENVEADSDVPYDNEDEEAPGPLRMTGSLPSGSLLQSSLPMGIEINPQRYRARSTLSRTGSLR